MFVSFRIPNPVGTIYFPLLAVSVKDAGHAKELKVENGQ